MSSLLRGAVGALGFNSILRRRGVRPVCILAAIRKVFPTLSLPCEGFRLSAFIIQMNLLYLSPKLGSLGKLGKDAIYFSN